jgi:hypothetical protein
VPDPFELLRAALAPEEPEPAFVARLRNRSDMRFVYRKELLCPISP